MRPSVGSTHTANQSKGLSRKLCGHHISRHFLDIAENGAGSDVRPGPYFVLSVDSHHSMVDLCSVGMGLVVVEDEYQASNRKCGPGVG